MAETSKRARGEYEKVEQRYGTGLLSPAVWAAEMGHDAPDLARFPAQMVTWQVYEEVRGA